MFLSSNNTYFSEKKVNYSMGQNYENKSVDNDSPGKVSDFFEDQFICALKLKNVRQVEELISQGVDINLKPVNNFSFLTLASSLGCYDLVQILVEKGADVVDNYKNITPILALCSSPSKDEDELLRCMDLLIISGADVNSCDFNRISALSHAVRNNHEKLILKLIMKGANINMTDDYGWSPIFYAVVFNNIYLVWLLKDYNADIYVLDRRDRSLIDIALEIGNYGIIELLNGSCNIGKWFTQLETEVKISANVFDHILKEFPSKEDRLSGFGQEIHTIFAAVQLSHLVKEFQYHNFGLGHLLTTDEAKLKEIGVHFWFERRKLLHAVEDFHEYPWSTSSFSVVSPHKELDFQIALLMGTLVRQFYLISVSTFWWTKLGGAEPEDEGIYETLKGSLKTLSANRGKLKTLQQIFKLIDKGFSTIPSDLILAKTYSKKFFIKPIILGTVLGAFIMETNLCCKIIDFLKVKSFQFMKGISELF